MLRLDAKGAVQRAPAIPPGVAGPPPSLTGAYLEVLDQGLAAGLPLQPGASLALPVSVVVGKPPGSYDASTMQVKASWRHDFDCVVWPDLLSSHCIALHVCLYNAGGVCGYVCCLVLPLVVVC